MGRSSVIAFVVCALLAHEAQAQSPRAGGPAPGDSDGETRLGADLTLGGNIARGFVDRELIAARGILQGWTGLWGMYIQPYWLYGRVGTPMGKLTTDNEIYVRTGVFRQLRETPFYIYGVTVWDRSVRRKIDYRNLTGAGLGVNLLTGKSLLTTSWGILGQVTNYDDRTLDNPDGPGTFEVDKRYWTLRWSGRIYGRFKLGTLSVIQDLIVVPTFTDPRDDYRILYYGAIDAPIAKGFSIRAQADATHEGLIAVGTKHADLAITFAVAYKNEWKLNRPASPAPSTSAR